MIKVKLLNDGGYDGLGNVKFPVVVNGTYYGSGSFLVDISADELILHGADHGIFPNGSASALFNFPEECEIIEIEKDPKGEELLHQLDTLSSLERIDIDNGEFSVTPKFDYVSVIELAGKAAKRIRELELAIAGKF